MEKLTPHAWTDRVRQRLRTARIQRSRTQRDLGSDLYETVVKYEITTRDLYLRPVLLWSQRIDVIERHMLEGWHGWQTGASPPVVPPMYRWIDVDELMERCRRNVCHIRRANDVSQVTTAGSAWGDEGLSTKLRRLESGEYRKWNLLRLYELATFFNYSVWELCFLEMENTDVQ